MEEYIKRKQLELELIASLPKSKDKALILFRLGAVNVLEEMIELAETVQKEIVDASKKSG